MSRTVIRVRYDSQIFILQKNGGISKYFAELILAFQRNPGLGIRPILSTRDFGNENLGRVLCRTKLEARAGHKVLQSLLLDSATLTRDDSDLVHHTFYSATHLRASRGPRVVSLYDMIPETRLSGIAKFSHLSKKRHLKSSSGIISISETSLGEATRVWGELTPLKQVIPLGVSENFSHGLSRPTGLPSRYVAFVGNREGYKNGMLAIRTMALAQQELCLVFCGPPPTEHERRQIKISGMESRVFFESPSEERLAGIYSNAEALLHLSSMEGFGLPILEGLRSGLPVVMLRNDINVEVSRGHGFFYQLETPTAVLAALNQALLARTKADVAERATFASVYSWDECARMTAKFYRTVLDSLEDGNLP